MALKPLWDNVWGVPIYERPYREEATLHTHFARQRKKMLHMILVKEVGDKCVYLRGGEIVILPEDHGGSVITINRADGEVEHRFCFKETVGLAAWTGDLPPFVTEAGVINIEE